MIIVFTHFVSLTMNLCSWSSILQHFYVVINYSIQILHYILALGSGFARVIFGNLHRNLFRRISGIQAPVLLCKKLHCSCVRKNNQTKKHTFAYYVSMILPRTITTFISCGLASDTAMVTMYLAGTSLVTKIGLKYDIL